MEEIPGSKPLKNRRHERVVQLVAAGVLLRRAWQKTSDEDGRKCTKDSAQQQSSALIVKPEVSARLKYLQEKNAEKTEFKREHAIQYLVSILQTPIGEIDEDHPLCEGKRCGQRGTVYWMPSKLAAMELLCRMMPGWLAPVRGEMTASPEAVEMLKALRNGEDLPSLIDITPNAGNLSQ